MATTYLIKNITHDKGNIVIDSLVLERDQSAFITSLTAEVMRAYTLKMISVDAVGNESTTEPMTRDDIIALIGFEPYDETNPSHFSKGSVMGISINDANGFTGIVNNTNEWPSLTLDLQMSDGSHNGQLSSTDWNTFNNKQSELGFMPYNSSNPNNYISENENISVTGDVSGSGTKDLFLTLNNIVTPSTGSKITFNEKGQVIASSNLASEDVISYLGFTPYNATNPNNYISGNQSITVTGDISGSGSRILNLTLPNIISAGIGSKITFNEKGQITASSNLNSSDVITSLGYTPYNATNPNAYTSNLGTVTNIFITSANGFSGSILNSTTIPTITLSIQNATASQDGKLTSTDWTTFNNKQNTLVSGTSIKTVDGNNILGSGDISIANKTITISGDVSGSGSSTLTLTLPNIVTASTFPKITFNAKGQVISGSNLISSDIPNLDYSKITSGKPTTLSGFGITDAQPLSTDLTNISALAGTSGLLKKTATNTWTLDTNTYYKSGDNIVANIIGASTNSNAAAGQVGEYIESSVAYGSAVNLTSLAVGNMTSISLTAGDWDVTGTIAFKAGVLTLVVYYQQGLSSTSATFGGVGTYTNLAGLSIGSGLDLTIDVPVVRFSLATTTTIYLIARSSFTLGTLGVYGNIRARRVR